MLPEHIPILSGLPMIYKRGGLATLIHLVTISSAGKEDRLELIRFLKNENKSEQQQQQQKPRNSMPFERTNCQQK